MNQNILQKAIDELRKEQPKIDYVLGMLETLYELGIKPEPVKLSVPVLPVLGMGNKAETPQDEAAMLDAKARTKLEMVKSLNQEA